MAKTKKKKAEIIEKPVTIKVKIHTGFKSKGTRYYGECEISESLANYVVKTGKGKLI